MMNHKESELSLDIFDESWHIKNKLRIEKVIASVTYRKDIAIVYM